MIDHAAVILKFEEHPNEVFFLEATSNNGVSLRRWSSIKPHLGTFYLKVVIRHIDWERTESSLENLEVFMKEVVGNSYSFSMKQLFKRQTVAIPKKSLGKSEIRPTNDDRHSTIMESDDDRRSLSMTSDARMVEEGRAFFCSELVAKCWKVCGVMKPTDQASSNFLPVNFSQHK